MQVVVKKPRIRLDGEITSELLRHLRDRYSDVEVIEDEDEDEDEEVIEVTKSDWYRKIRRQLTPGDNML